MDVHALQGGGKAISAEHASIEFNDADDDATQLQKCAAVLFGFAGEKNCFQLHMYNTFCSTCASACKSASPCAGRQPCKAIWQHSCRWQKRQSVLPQVHAARHMWRYVSCFQTWRL
jgi:hypothetical protein